MEWSPRSSRASSREGEIGLEELSDVQGQPDDKHDSKRLIKQYRILGILSDNWKAMKITWKDNHAWPVLCSTFVANILLLNFGISLGYASPAIPDLQTDDEVTSINDTSIIFSALVPFGAVVSGPIAGICLDAFGRHVTLMICAIPFTLGWLLIMLTRLISGHAFLPTLYAGRFLTGFGLGWANAGVPCYAAELSPSALRGLFGGGFFSVFLTAGIFLIQLCGVIPGATYYWLPVVPLITLLAFVVLMPFTVETPRWLIKAKKIEDARAVLSWLRGSHWDIDTEIDEISKQVSKNSKQNIFRSIKHRSTFYPLILGCCLTSLAQLGGMAALGFYSQVIFRDVKSLSDNADILAAFCVGGAQLSGAVVFLLFVDKFGRRKVLIFGAITMCVSTASMGVYYVFNSKPYCDPKNVESTKCVDILAPLTIVSMSAFSFSFAAAWSGVPYLVAAELLPLYVRGAGVGVVTCAGWLGATILLLAFEPLQKTINPWGAVFTLSIITFIATLFVYIFIPETKGKTLEEIQCFFSKSKKNVHNLSNLEDSSGPISTPSYGTYLNETTSDELAMAMAY